MCVCARSLVLVPGRTSSGSELLGSSVGVSDVDTGKCRGREKKENDIERNERVRGIKGNSTIGSHFLNAHIHTYTHSQRKNHPQRLAVITAAALASLGADDERRPTSVTHTF